MGPHWVSSPDILGHIRKHLNLTEEQIFEVPFMA